KGGTNNMNKTDLVELLASCEHASWARWMKYLFEKCEEYYDGDGYEMLAIPRELVTHWKRQVATPYSELSEREKQSDREEVKHILPIIEEYKLRGDLIEPPTARSTVVRWIDCNEDEHVVSTTDDDE